MRTAVALTGSATQVVRAGPAQYAGLSIRETAGSALVLRLWDNASAASGTLVEVITVAASGSATVALPDPIRCAAGLYLERVSGSTYEGSIRLA
jgi:hypothetical protein